MGMRSKDVYTKISMLIADPALYCWVEGRCEKKITAQQLLAVKGVFAISLLAET